MKKPKQCKNEACKEMLTLECYTEEVQTIVIRKQNILNKHHLCPQCIKKKIRTRSAMPVENRLKRLSLVPSDKLGIIARHVNGRKSRSCARTKLSLIHI